MGERREYGRISKRSKEILGEEVLPNAADDVPSNVCDSKKAHSSADGLQKDKRRSQVLQAQRTHRQRTQTYIKMLEREVLRLRESEKAALDNARTLQKQVEELQRQLMVHAGPSTPPRSAASDDAQSCLSGHPELPIGEVLSLGLPPHEPMAPGIVSASIGGARGVYVNVEFPEFLRLDALSGGSVSPPTSTSTTSDYEQSHQSDLPGMSGPGVWPTASAAFLSEAPETPYLKAGSSQAFLSDPRVGIEFVLRLETDCMDHLRGKHLDHVHSRVIDSESDFSGHVSTASLSLWQRQTTNLSSSATYQISNSELERLLSTSLNLGLASPEITPVQIWNRIRWLEFRAGRESLEQLTRELKEEVFCLGFGAVLHEAVVQEILKRYFTELPPL